MSACLGELSNCKVLWQKLDALFHIPKTTLSYFFSDKDRTTGDYQETNICLFCFDYDVSSKKNVARLCLVGRKITWVDNENDEAILLSEVLGFWWLIN